NGPFLGASRNDERDCCALLADVVQQRGDPRSHRESSPCAHSLFEIALAMACRRTTFFNGSLCGELDREAVAWESRFVKSCGPSGSRDLALFVGQRIDPLLHRVEVGRGRDRVSTRVTVRGSRQPVATVATHYRGIRGHLICQRVPPL